MRVMNNTKQIMNLGGHVILLPGLNANVDREAFEKATQIKLVQWHIEQGNLGPADGDEEDPTKVPEPAALKMIGQTIQVDFLQAWASREKRARVSEALGRRLELLRPPAPKTKDDDEPAPKRR